MRNVLHGTMLMMAKRQYEITNGVNERRVQKDNFEVVSESAAQFFSSVIHENFMMVKLICRYAISRPVT